ncbi:MAG: S41 family peptidase [Ruminococcus sp.]
MEKERVSKSAVCILTSAAVISASAAVLLYAKNRNLENIIGETSKLIELQNYIDENYYTETDKESAAVGALKGYVMGLGDPYSQYLTAEEYEGWQEKESGTMVGIGVTVQADDKGLYITDVEEGYPADKSGLKSGDIITAVEGEGVIETGYDKAVESVRGEEGTIVSLTILRKDREMKINVLRSEINIATAKGYMLENDIGYIRISAFRQNTDEQFLEALSQLTSNGAKGIIFDLRDNGGGMLSALCNMLDPLLPEGNIAIATYGNGEIENIVTSKKGELDLPMAVLVNGNTASAAELFAASLSDFDKAFLVGETTFGKGVMQTTREVAGGALTLTVATYQTVLGECYHGTGITPDYEVSVPEDYEINYSSPDTENDIQLREAYVNILKSV